MADGALCQLWDLRQTSSPVREYTGHTQDTTACVFLHGKTRATAAEANGDEGCGPEKGGTSPPQAEVYGRMIATASKDGTIKIYNLSSGARKIAIIIVVCYMQLFIMVFVLYVHYDVKQRSLMSP